MARSHRPGEDQLDPGLFLLQPVTEAHIRRCVVGRCQGPSQGDRRIGDREIPAALQDCDGQGEPHGLRCVMGTEPRVHLLTGVAQPRDLGREITARNDHRGKPGRVGGHRPLPQRGQRPGGLQQDRELPVPVRVVPVPEHAALQQNDGVDRPELMPGDTVTARPRESRRQVGATNEDQVRVDGAQSGQRGGQPPHHRSRIVAVHHGETAAVLARRRPPRGADRRHVQDAVHSSALGSVQSHRLGEQIDGRCRTSRTGRPGQDQQTVLPQQFHRVVVPVRMHIEVGVFRDLRLG